MLRKLTAFNQAPIGGLPVDAGLGHVVIDEVWQTSTAAWAFQAPIRKTEDMNR